jgi:AAA family ATP:ADP antiporter
VALLSSQSLTLSLPFASPSLAQMGRKPQAAAESPVSAPGTTVQEVEKIVTGIVDGRVPSAEVDEAGRPWLEGEAWQKMGAGSAHQKQGDSAMEALFKKLYGDLPVEERWRVAWLAGTLFFIIGGYWLLRSLKDPIVSTIVGVEYIPKCKMMSLVVVFALVFVYNKLVDMFPKHQLFYIVGGFYFFTFATIAYLLADPVTGLANTNADPWRLLGWVSYCSIESFGSICVSLFWAFVNSSMDFDGAKSAYGLIIAGAQTGSILGPTMAATFSHTLGVPRLYGLGAMCMGMMVVMVWGYVRIFGVSQALAEVGGDKKKKGAGVLEGFRLFIKHDYVKGIFALSCLFMVEVTILDYIMKVLAQTTFLDEAERAAAAGELDVGANPKEVATEAFAAFMGGFGQVGRARGGCVEVDLPF